MTSSAFDPAHDDLFIASRKEIVFIEDNVADIDTLIKGIGSGKEIVILDSTQDGVHQIAQALVGRSGIDALHVIAHGTEGAADFGALQLNGPNTGAHSGDLAAIGLSMAAGGDILLYGCNIGAGENGAGFLEQLAIATGADVAGSNDKTGSAALGGDWDLEVTSGSIETPVVVNAQTAALYQQVLNIGSANVDFHVPGNFIPTSFDTTNAATDTIYKVNGNIGYQLIIDGEDQGTSAYTYENGSSNSYVTAAPHGGDHSVTIRFNAGQIFTASSIAIANFDSTSPVQNLVIKGYDFAGHQVGSTATGPVTYTAGTVTKVPFSLTGMTGITSLKITATTNNNLVTYLVIDDLSLTNIQPAPPHVTFVSSSTANGTYKIGDTIDVLVNFDNAVDVTGTPQLTLETGTTDRTINYVSGTGSSALTFRYTVQAGDVSSDLDYTNSAIALNGGTIKAYNSTQDALITLPASGAGGSLASNKNIVVDGVAPTMTITSDRSVLKAGETAAITFTFSEDPGATFTWNGSTGDVAVSGGTLSALQGSGITRNATFTPTANTNSGTASISVGAGSYSDAAGNNNSVVSNGPAITYDTLRPTVTITSDNPSLKVGETATITFTFSEDPGATFTWNGSGGDVAVSGGTLSAIQGSGATRTASFTPTANTNNGTASISVSAGTFSDAAGNFNTSAGVTPAITYDTKAPTLAIGSSNASLKGGETATITFTFGEDPGPGFDNADIAVSGGTLSAIQGSGTTRTAVFTPTAGVDSSTATISVTGTNYADAAGNAGANASVSFGYDTLAPTTPGAPNLASGSDSGASDSDDVTKANPLSFSGSADNGATVRLYDGATEVGHVTASGGSYTIAVTDLGEGSHTLTAIAYDAAGNASAASGGLTVEVDRTPPPTSVASAALSADTGPSSTDMITKLAAPQTISGTLSANLAAGEQVMVSLDNGASWNPASASAGANTWSLDVTLTASGILKVQVVDLAGNGGPVYAHAYTLDQTPPAAPSTPDLDSGSDSGSSDTDNVTGVTLPTFSGTAEVGSTVRLFDGGVEIGSVVAADGTWHITTSSATPMSQRPDNSPHTITAIATDLAGNSSASSATLEVQVLTGGPATTVASMALSSDSGVNGDFITNTPSQTVSGTLSATLAAGEHVQVSLNNGGTWTNTTSTVGQNTWSLPVGLSEGSHDIQVRVVDAADNFGAVLTQAYTLDTAKPAVVVTSSAAQLKLGETATITFTFSEDPGASFDGSDLTVSGGALSAISGSGAIRTAIFTPTAGTNGGTASIVVNADSYADLAGNAGTVGATPSVSFDTLAPAAPSAPDLHKDSDSGALDTDNLTHDTAPVFTGTAEAGATVRLYDTDTDTDGVTEIGHGTADGSGNWTITTSTLLDGSHTVTAKAFDAAGNASAASSALTVTIDTTKPAAMAAPVLAAGSDSGAPGDGITKVAKPTFKGTAEANAQVTLYDGAAVLGTATADALGAWTFTPAANLSDDAHAITARQADRAGNQSDAGVALSLTVDTLAPAAPPAPLLKASSDSGIVGDGVTDNNRPVIEGTALANTLVTLYDATGAGTVRIGTATADGSGKWSMTAAGLRTGAHSLTATQSDAAGNESAASAAYLLHIEEPPVQVNTVDGVPVDIHPISLPGGVIGSAVSIPIVSAGRTESSGHAGVADIPLVTSGDGSSWLLAQVPAGVGLSASGASVPHANGAELLLAAIKAATPSHAASDQGYLTGNGQSFLDGLSAGGTLLVETVKPVSAANAPDAVLTLSGPAQPHGQSTALVIDAGGLGVGATIALQDVSFAAVIGAANVVSTGSMILTGDAASQHFTVAAGAGPNAVLAGGGKDILTLSPSGSGAGAVMLHGGAADDVAAFSGARADYKLDFHNGYVTVTTKAGPPTIATVVNVETLQFSDGSVAVQNSADMNTLAGLYQTVLGRQADISGIEFWANGHQGGANWGNIALNMIGSSERLASHEGFTGVAAHDITLLYTALFNRAPDAEGLAFWANAMAHGVSLEHVAGEFVLSAEMIGHQRGALDWEFIAA